MTLTTQDCAAMLRVLADPTRLGVARLLLEQPQRVGELNAQLGIDQSLLSHHLKVMRDAGIVLGDRDGKAVRYRLSPKLVQSSTRDAIDLGCCTLCFQGKEGS